MSSQKDAGIPLMHASDGVGYKLLELPPELLALLESEDPPVSVEQAPVPVFDIFLTSYLNCSLILESSTDSAVIKSGTQSWRLRQKNTSNALILLKSCEGTPSSSSQIAEPSLKAIATVHDTIELVSESSAKTEPVARGKWHERFARGR
ncbi:hypothetical protein F4820DRAFT_373453 [Hypoxylon rubiginosum]|uniref:Uncharacterized protein n=1 Tax=Hypoxylon rubiginosum TaxID=110542 RepID=A0ACB9YWG5_9PEZI|nr:hypothetical protein F4820DRAFT_373453 [Hypoxylon rubiginosum]